MTIRNGNLFIQNTESKGRGVFAAAAFAIGDLIETCPIILLNEKDIAALEGTTLYDYYFLWNEEQTQAALALGYGSMYNHANQSNAHYVMDAEEAIILIHAIAPISPGDEITINYNGKPGDDSALWFDAV